MFLSGVYCVYVVVGINTTGLNFVHAIDCVSYLEAIATHVYVYIYINK